MIEVSQIEKEIECNGCGKVRPGIVSIDAKYINIELCDECRKILLYQLILVD